MLTNQEREFIRNTFGPHIARFVDLSGTGYAIAIHGPLHGMLLMPVVVASPCGSVNEVFQPLRYVSSYEMFSIMLRPCSN